MKVIAVFLLASLSLTAAFMNNPLGSRATTDLSAKKKKMEEGRASNGKVYSLEENLYRSLLASLSLTADFENHPPVTSRASSRSKSRATSLAASLANGRVNGRANSRATKRASSRANSRATTDLSAKKKKIEEKKMEEGQAFFDKIFTLDLSDRRPRAKRTISKTRKVGANHYVHGGLSSAQYKAMRANERAEREKKQKEKSAKTIKFLDFIYRKHAK